MDTVLTSTTSLVATSRSSDWLNQPPGLSNQPVRPALFYQQII